jgi:hypothetical protein
MSTSIGKCGKVGCRAAQVAEAEATGRATTVVEYIIMAGVRVAASPCLHITSCDSVASLASTGLDESMSVTVEESRRPCEASLHSLCARHVTAHVSSHIP